MKRSKPDASCSVKIPMGLFDSSTIIIAPCARLWMRLSALPTVSVGARVIGVSNTA